MTNAAMTADYDNSTEKVLSVENLSVSFNGEPAVVDVSFDIRRGETVALVGESGSGKSVTALSILQLLPYPIASHPGGSVWLGDTQTVGADHDLLRSIRGSKVAMIFQEPMTSLNPLHRIEKQIGEVMRVHRGIAASEAKPKILELLNLVGLQNPEEKLSAYPHELSGGQRQRVMIAMALANEPDLLIADEPTTALDVTVQKQILRLIKEQQIRTKAAVLIITHDLGVVAKICNRVSIIHSGMIVENQSIQGIFKRPKSKYLKALLDATPRYDKPA